MDFDEGISAAKPNICSPCRRTQFVMLKIAQAIHRIAIALIVTISAHIPGIGAATAQTAPSITSNAPVQIGFQPHSIEDLAALIRASRQSAASIKDLIAQAQATVPASEPPTIAAAAHMRAGSANRRLGNGKLAEMHFRSAESLLRPEASRAWMNAISSLSVVLPPERIGEISPYLDALESNGHVAPWIPLTRADVHRQNGDFDKARQELIRVEAVRLKGMNGLQGTPQFGFFDALTRGHQSRAQAILAFNLAELADAERHARAAILQFELAITRYSLVPESVPLQPLAGFTATLGFARLDLVNVLLQAGKLVDAELEAKAALRSELSFYSNTHELMLSQVSSLAQVLAARGRYDEARFIMQSWHTTIADADRDATDSLNVRYNATLLDIAMASDDWEGAAQIGLQVWQDISMAGKPASGAKLWSPNLITALALSGRHEQALQLNDASLSWLDNHSLRIHPSYEHHQILGAAIVMSSPDQSMPRSAPAEIAQRAFELRLSAGRDSNRALRNRYRFAIEAFLNRYAPPAGKAECGAQASEAFGLAEVLRDDTGRMLLQSAAGSDYESGAATSADSSVAARQLARDRAVLDLQVSALQDLVIRLHTIHDATGLANLTAAQNRLREIETRRAQIADPFRAPPASQIAKQWLGGAIANKLRASLHPGEALVTSYFGQVSSHVWTISANRELCWYSASIGRDEQRQWVSKIRKTLDPEQWHLQGLPAFDHAAAEELYSRIFKLPISALADSVKLIVVTHDTLSALPVGVLLTETAVNAESRLLESMPWLIRKYAISQLPSAADFLQLRSTPHAVSHARTFLGIGDPVLGSIAASAGRGPPEAAHLRTQGVPTEPMPTGLVTARSTSARIAPPVVDSAVDRPPPKPPSGLRRAHMLELPPLPESAEELKNIAAALGQKSADALLLGASANKERLGALNLNDFRIIAFATHGLAPGDIANLYEPALALSVPPPEYRPTSDSLLDSGAKYGHHPSLLTASDILNLKLSAELVVLSACNTAGSNGYNERSVLGLGQAFLYAGARSLLVSHWSVDSAATRDWMSQFFRRYGADPMRDKAGLARESTLSFVDDVSNAGRQHPFYWAAFTYIGD